MPPFLFGAAMRYLSVLLLSPSLAYAACAPGVNYGSLGISSPSPICIAYSGSSLGGCSAYCGGVSGSTVCVELPLDTPPSKGPYFSDGNECEIGGGGDDGGGDDGGGETGGAPYYYPFKDQISPIVVGGDYQDATTAALKQIDEDLRWTAIKLYGQGEESLATFKTFSRDLTKVTDALTIQSNNAEESGKTQLAILQTLSRSEDSLLRLTNCVTNPFNNNCEHLGGDGNTGGPITETDILDIINALWASNNILSGVYSNVGSINDNIDYLNRKMAWDVDAIRGMMQNNQGPGSGSGGDGSEGGDKPCTGPLCSFTKPSSSSGSALSEVFSVESIDDVKKQIENKDTEISAAMNDIKSVFAPEELTITGTYNNDYHDINGVRVDLSGKSNLELFFNSGPKMAIWFLAVLLAFSILMGGRKNA